MSVGFGFSVTPGEPVALGEELRRAEGFGYHRVGIWDSPALFREPWTTLASVARDTSRIRIGTWVTNPLSRHPLVTAAAAATLDDLAPGRVYLGIGAGGTGVWHLGMGTARLAELEAYVLTVRALLERGAADWKGHALTLPWAGPRRIPIVMGAHAAKSLRLAGKIGDGVVIGLGISPDVVAASLELLDEAGRSDELEVWFTSFWWVDEEPGKAKADGAWSATAFALHFADSGVENKFIPEELKAPLLEIGKAYDLQSHGHPSDEQKAGRMPSVCIRSSWSSVASWACTMTGRRSFRPCCRSARSTASIICWTAASPLACARTCTRRAKQSSTIRSTSSFENSGTPV